MFLRQEMEDKEEEEGGGGGEASSGGGGGRSGIIVDCGLRTWASADVNTSVSGRIACVCVSVSGRIACVCVCARACLCGYVYVCALPRRW